MNKKLIKTSEVKKMVGIQSFTSLVNFYKAGLFPVPIRLGNRQLLWRADEVEQWMLRCPRIDCNSAFKESDQINGKYALKFISIKEVRSMTGISSTTTIYRLMKTGSFPCRVQVSDRKVAWFEHEVLAWIAQQSKCV